LPAKKKEPAPEMEQNLAAVLENLNIDEKRAN
jgi:hypothetical protein